MSTSVDNRVVRMQFDNKNFEKNVGKTLTSLDSLQRSLELKGATRGLEEVDKASRKCDLSSVGTAADSVKVKLSAMGVVGATVISRLTNKVMDLGHAMLNNLKQFTTAPIHQGFAEYELKMGSVQTIVASTGEELAVVNKYLEELNTYSDKTIYSFADMTSSIGKFTNAGVSLDDAVRAIQGISNEAAVSGANAQEASHAMYNFAQALSAGSVKLIDWKSIENANMATREFKQELIDTAVELGTLRKEEDGYISTTTDARGKVSSAFTATKNFNDALSSQWMTTDVLIKTLGRYADETTDIGKKAFAAAQDVKTFSQMIDTIKESIGSGWAQISELMFGDLNEAKELWTSINDVISNKISSVFEKVTGFLSSNLKNQYKQFYDDSPIHDIERFESAFDNAAKRYGIDIEALKEGTKDFVSYFNNFDRTVAIEARFQKLDALTDKERERLGVTEEMQEAYHGLIEQLKTGNKDLNDILVEEAMMDYANSILTMSEAELKSAGVTKEQYNELFKLRVALKNGTIDVEEFTDKWNMMSGRMNFIKGFARLFKPLSQILGVIKESFIDVFSDGSNTQWLYNLSKSFYDFTGKIQLSEERLSQLKNIFSSIFKVAKNVVKLFKAIIDPIKAIASPVIIGAFKIIAGSLISISSGAAYVIEYLTESNRLAAIGAKIYEKMGEAVDWIGEKSIELFEYLYTIPFFAKIIDDIKAAKNWFVNLFSGIKDGSKSTSDVLSMIKSIPDKIVNAFNQLKTSTDGLADGMAGLWDKLVEKVNTFYETVKEKFEYIKEKSKWIKDNAGALIGVSYLASSTVILFKFARSVSKALGYIEDVRNYAKTIMGTVSIFNNVLKSVGKSVKKYLNAKALDAIASALVKISLSILILVGVVWVASKIPWQDMIKGGALVIGLMVSLVFILSQLGKMDGLKGAATIAIITGAILMLAISISIISGAMKGESSIGDRIAMMTIVLGSLAALCVIAIQLGKYGKKAVAGAIAMALVAGALLSVMIAIQAIASMKISSMLDAVKKLVLVLGTFMIAMKILRKANSDGAAKAGLGLLAFAGAMLLLVPAIKLLSMLRSSTIHKACMAMSEIMIVFGIIIFATKFAGENAHKAALTILAMSLAIIPLAGVAILLGYLDPKRIAVGVAAVMLIVLSMSVLVAAASGLSKGIGVLITLTAMILAISTVVVVLAMLPDPAKAMYAAGALSFLLLALAGMVAVVSIVKVNPLAMLMLFAATLVIGVLAIIVVKLSEIESVDKALGATKVLAMLLFELGAFMLIAAGVGALAEPAAIGLGVILAFMAIVGGILAMLGEYGGEKALNAINQGIPILKAVAKGLGEAIGEFHSAIIDSIMNSLVDGGDKLNLFMDKVVTAAKKVKDIPEGFGSNMVSIAAAISLITATDIITGLTDFLGISGNFDTLKLNLVALGEGLRAMDDAMGSSISMPRVKNAVEAGAKISEMARGIPDSGGYWGKFWGENDLDTFANQFETFGLGLNALSKQGETVNYDNIDNAVKSGLRICELADAIPNFGGRWAKFWGDNKLDLFANQFETFGIGINKLGEQGGTIVYDGVDSAVKAGLRVCDLAESIPNFGGRWAKFWGDNKLDEFANQFSAFGAGLIALTNAGRYIVLFQIDKACEAGSKLAALARDNTGFGDNWSRFWNVDSIEKLNQNMNDLGTVMTTLSTASVNIDTDGVFRFSTAGSELADICTRISGINVGNVYAFQDAIDALSLWLSDFKWGGILDFDTPLTELTSYLGQIITKLYSHKEIFRSHAAYAVGGLTEGIEDEQETFTTTISNLIDGALQYINDSYQKAFNSGYRFGEGFTRGLAHEVDSAEDIATNLGDSTHRALNESLDINSPSRKAYKSGQYYGQGFANGIADSVHLTKDSVTDMGMKSMKTISDVISRMNEAISSDMNLQPTIAPVLDTKGIHRQIRGLNASLNGSQINSIVASHKAAKAIQNGTDSTTNNSNVYQFTQNNYSPKALSRSEIFRQTRNQFSRFKEVTQNA